MRTNDERFRFLAQFELSITWNDAKPSIFWRGRPSPGKPGGYFPIAEGPTLEEAVDRAIERWEKKHGRRFQ